RKYFPRGTTLALRSLRAKNCVDSLFDHIHSLIHISFSSAPSLTGLQVFGIQPAPPGQYYCTSERYIAAMYDLLDQLGSIVGNIHSISDTFIVPDGIAGGALLDVIMLPGSKPGICFSDIPGGWDLSMVRNMDVFRRQALLSLLGNDPTLRDAAYAHSRL
ncbi:hypothetical protein B0H14DRAFT_2702396, partial [Mycena olivaceomarginata]